MNMMNVRTLQEKQPVIDMGPVRSSVRSRNSPPKGSPPKGVANRNPYNSNVCFLCGKAGHYGNQSSCHAANKVRK